MGKLRIQPKLELDETKLPEYVEVLKEASADLDNFDYFWNLEEGEIPETESKLFLQAAEQLNITLMVTKLRKPKRLHLIIRPNDKIQQFQMELIALLRTKKEPLKKAQIISALQMPQSSWRHVMPPLIKQGEVLAIGVKRNCRFQLPPENPS